MAKHLIEEMSGNWSADQYRDSFHDAILKLVEAKARAGDTETVAPLEEPPESQGAEVIDLTELLRRSLKGGTRSALSPTARKAPAKRAARAAPARKPPARRAA